jgi:hypothetical protein
MSLSPYLFPGALRGGVCLGGLVELALCAPCGEPVKGFEGFESGGR